MPSQARVGEIATSVATGNAGRIVLGQALQLLSTGYGLAQQQNGQVIGQTTEYLDGIRVRAEADYAALPISDEILPIATSNQIAFDVASIEEAIGVETGTFTSTAIDDFLQPITDVAKQAANLVTPAGGFPLWIVLGAVAAIVILYLVKK
jgi:hypothetical protein